MAKKGPEDIFSDEVREVFKHRSDVFAFRIESSHTCPGIPDWCVFYQGGRVFFLELKAGASLTPAQRVIHGIMQRLGIEFYILTKTDNGVRINSKNPQTLKQCIESILEEKPDE